MPNLLILVHGFGVQSDYLDLLTDIEQSLLTKFDVIARPEFYHLDQSKNQLHIYGIKTHASKIQQIINNYSNCQITIIAHSQGSVSVGQLSKKYLERIKKIILLAPPNQSSSDSLKDLIKRRSNSIFNPGGLSVLTKRDGQQLLIHSDYWKDLAEIDHLAALQEVENNADLLIINADDDEMIPAERRNFDHLKRSRILSIKADHNFTSVSRQPLLDLINKEL